MAEPLRHSLHVVYNKLRTMIASTKLTPTSRWGTTETIKTTRPLISHHDLSPLTVNTLDLLSYLYSLIEGSSNLWLSSHINLYDISQTLINRLTFSTLVGIKYGVWQDNPVSIDSYSVTDIWSYRGCSIWPLNSSLQVNGTYLSRNKCKNWVQVKGDEPAGPQSS